MYIILMNAICLCKYLASVLFNMNVLVYMRTNDVKKSSIVAKVGDFFLTLHEGKLFSNLNFVCSKNIYTCITNRTQ